MAVVIASDLGKDMAGEPLLRGVSFKLERRDRHDAVRPQRRGQDDAAADARRRDVDRRRRARRSQKGAQVALHDQRPPRERDLTLRDYVLSGCAELARARGSELARLEQAMADGAHDEATLDAYAPRAGAARARRRLPLARAARSAMLHGLGFARRATSTARCGRSPAAS